MIMGGDKGEWIDLWEWNKSTFLKWAAMLLIFNMYGYGYGCMYVYG